MLASTIATLLALVASQAWARPAKRQQQDVCSQAPFASLLCLKGAEAARSVCHSLLPARTVTTTMSTTTFDVVTVTRSYNAQTQSTAFSQNPSGAFSQTTITTTIGNSTSLAIGTETVTLDTSTTTTYIPTTAAPTSSTPPPPAVRRQASSCTNADAAMSTLEDSACPIACSCLGFPRRTRTVTKTATFAAPSTTTSIIGAAPVTTIVSLAGPTVVATVTNPASTTISATATVSLTPATTVTLAAPTYTQVYGPTAGCEDMMAVTGLSLGNNVTDAAVAENQCKEFCTQTQQCRSVWVQRLFVDWEDQVPFFACYVNSRPLKADRDIKCGRPTGVFGVANAWDAVGRGTVPL